MIRKLLHITQQVYLVFLIAIFLVIAPLFYFIVNSLYITNADESLLLHKTIFINKSLPQLHESDISIWNKYNMDIKILASKGLKNDSIFYTTHINSLEQEEEPYRELLSPINIDNKPYTLSVKMNLLESEDLIVGIAFLFILILLLLFVGLYFINKKLSKKLWKPFYKTLQQIKDFEIDKNKQPFFKNSTIKEFNELNQSIHKLISRNIEIYKSQREFIDNAAHELQTPLAVFRSQLDILIQRDDLTKGQAKIIKTINNNIDRLIKLNKNLLILSKLERSKELEIEQFNLKSLLEKQVAFFKEQANSKQINIILKADTDKFVKANKNLTEILFSNLLLNAIQHNIKNGMVQIEVFKDKVLISNTSELSKIPKEQLFNRFSKSHKKQIGNGLGLAIVKKITNQQKWSVSYSFSKNTHHFTVQF